MLYWTTFSVGNVKWRKTRLSRGRGIELHSFLGIKNGELAERTQYADSGWHCIKALQEV